MALSVSCSCCTLVSVSAVYCGYLCYPSAVMRQWPLWSNPVPLSLIRFTCVVPLFLRCCVICHMVLIAQCGKVLRLPLRSYRLCNQISQFQFDTPTKIGIMVPCGTLLYEGLQSSPFSHQTKPIDFLNFLTFIYPNCFVNKSSGLSSPGMWQIMTRWSSTCSRM